MTTEPNQPTEESWIGQFLNYTKNLPSPLLFRKWAAVSCLMGALERRVFVYNYEGAIQLFPSHYIILVGEPGSGKSVIINQVKDFWVATSALKIGPDSATKAAMIDAVLEAVRPVKDGAETYHAHCLQVASSELGNLIHKYDSELINFYNRMWDCPDMFHDKLRYGEQKDVNIDYVQLNLLGGTQPSYLGITLPSEAWGLGFAARVMFVYSNEKHKVDPLAKIVPGRLEQRKKEFSTMVQGLKKLLEFSGEMKYSDQGAEYYRNWYMNVNDKTQPTHPKLSSYNVRRGMHLQKAAMVFAAARWSMTIEEKDVADALKLVHETEEVMPEIFKGMVTQESAEIMNELHRYAVDRYKKTNKAIPENVLIDYLIQRVEIRIVDQLMKHMISTGLLKVEPLTDPKRYIPKQL